MFPLRLHSRRISAWPSGPRPDRASRIQPHRFETLAGVVLLTLAAAIAALALLGKPKPLTVVATNPPHGGVQVGVGSHVTIIFSRPVDQGSVRGALSVAPLTEGLVSAAGRRAVFTPTGGQIGTQFDGPGHIGVRTSKGDFFYNGRWREQAYERGAGTRVIGMGDLGVEFVAEKGYVCRGVLLDGAAYRGVKRLPIPKDTKSPGIITAADVKAMVQKQGLAELGEGDCVFLHTGHGDLWLNAEWKGLSPEEKAKRRAEFTSGEPGYGVSACQYFAERKVILTGGDTSANDAQPVGEQEDYAVPCHTELQTRRGIWNIENLEFTQLLKDKAYEFAFVWAPLKMVGATGSPGNPIALY